MRRIITLAAIAIALFAILTSDLRAMSLHSFGSGRGCVREGAAGVAVAATTCRARNKSMRRERVDLNDSRPWRAKWRSAARVISWPEPSDNRQFSLAADRNETEVAF